MKKRVKAKRDITFLLSPRTNANATHGRVKAGTKGYLAFEQSNEIGVDFDNCSDLVICDWSDVEVIGIVEPTILERDELPF